MPSQIKYRDLDWDPLSIIFHPVTMRNKINNMEEKNIYEKKKLTHDDVGEVSRRTGLPKTIGKLRHYSQSLCLFFLEFCVFSCNS